MRIRRNTNSKIFQSLSMTIIAAAALVLQPFAMLKFHDALADGASVKMKYFNTQGTTAPAAAIYFGFDFTGITDATGVDVIIERASGGDIVKSLKPDKVEEYMNGGGTSLSGYTYTIESSTNNEETSSSWQRARYTDGSTGFVQWNGSTRPTYAKAVVTTVSKGTIESEKIEFTETPSIPYLYPDINQNNVSLDAYYTSGSGYTAVSVDANITGVNSATGLELCVDNGDGVTFGDHCIYANQVVLDSYNKSNTIPGGVTQTGPIIMKGSRSSNSWKPQLGTWSGAERPSKVRAKLTLKGGQEVYAYSDYIANFNGNTEDSVFADTNAPLASLETSGTNTVGGVNYIRPGDKLNYKVTAVDLDSGLNRASHVVFKLMANGTKQDGSVCGSWSNGKFPLGMKEYTYSGSLTMKDCNGGENPEDRLYGLAFRVYDNAGNYNRIDNYVYYVDGTDPIVSGLEFSALVSKSLSISAEAEDAASGVESVRFYVAEMQNGVCKNNYPAISDTYSQRATEPSSGKYHATIDTSGLNGKYCVLVSARDNVKNNSTPVFKVVTIDNDAPSAPEIKNPSQRQWFKAAPIVNSWTAADDELSGVDYYQIAYNYDDGHPFGGVNSCPDESIQGVSGFVGCRNVYGLSREHKPESFEQGGVTIWVRAVDKAGNVSQWSEPVHYYYDPAPPSASDINVNVNGGVVTLSGEVSDNFALNRLYVQLVSRKDNKRYGGTTINLIPEGKGAHWENVFNIRDLGWPEGEYAAHISATDMAGNTTNVGWTSNFEVKYDPVLSANYFVPHSDHLGVGFFVDRFYDVERVEVAIYEDGASEPFVTNVGDSDEMRALLNSHSGEISSPFYIPSQPNDEYWSFGTAEWANHAPSYAKITVYYDGKEKSVTVDFTNANGDNPSLTYEALLANLDIPNDDENQDDQEEAKDSETGQNDDKTGGNPTDDVSLVDNPVLGLSTERNNRRSTLVSSSLFGQPLFALSNTDNESTSTNNSDEQDEAPNEDSRVLAAQDTNEESQPAEEKSCASFMGLCWYWWVGIVAGIGLVVYLFVSFRSVDEDLPRQRP